MRRIARSCLKAVLKMVNSIMGMVGIAMILYSFWMVRVWRRDMDDHSSDPFAAPWFIYSFLSIGVTLCLITCMGHVSADSSNGFCLSCYTLIITVVLLLETAVAADILLNSDWEKDLPEDPTGRFHDFKQFVQSNFDVFKWIGFLIILAQGSSILSAMALRALGPNNRFNDDSDDEYIPTTARHPLLLNHHLQPSPYVGGPPFPTKNDVWNANK